MTGKLTQLIGRIKRHSIIAWSWIFPKECLGCGQEDTFLCYKCQLAIPLLKDPVCFLCNKNFSTRGVCDSCQVDYSLDQIIIATQYQNTLAEKIISNLKYHFVVELVEPLVGLLSEQIRAKQINLILQSAILIPVPIHYRRFLKRGFNQSELIAEKLAELYHCVLETDVVKRTKNSRPQVGKNRQQRIENVQDSFAVLSSEKVLGKTVVVLDDVFTTGATMNELARVLKNAGAQQVIGLAVAHE